MGCYLALRNASTLERVVVAIGHRSIGAELLVSGYFNTDLELPYGNERDEAISKVMET